MCTEVHGKDLIDFKTIGLIGFSFVRCQLSPDHSLEHFFFRYLREDDEKKV